MPRVMESGWVLHHPLFKGAHCPLASAGALPEPYGSCVSKLWASTPVPSYVCAPGLSDFILPCSFLDLTHVQHGDKASLFHFSFIIFTEMEKLHRNVGQLLRKNTCTVLCMGQWDFCNASNSTLASKMQGYFTRKTQILCSWEKAPWENSVWNQ